MTDNPLAEENSQALLPLALTMGEPAGIGTEITLKAWQYYSSQFRPGDPSFFLIDDPVRLGRAIQNFELSVPLVTISRPETANEAFGQGLPVMPLSQDLPDAKFETQYGNPAPETVPAVIQSIRQALSLALDGRTAGVVTNPIQKKVLLDTGFPHPGHTEFLGELTKDAPLPQGVLRGPVMMLAGADLKVAPVTVHLPLAHVPGALTPQRIASVCLVVAQALTRDFGIARPRIAVSGLNPHAGEGGALGQEDITHIAPAIAELRKNGLDVIGPLPADTMFHEEARAQYHAAVTMYHDQGLIPVKTIAFHSAANITLGLPIVRTSPDHGTGLDIAGKGVARPDSLITAIAAATRMAAARAAFDAAAIASA